MLNDFRFGIRMLTKNPAFTAVAVLSLALGIGANTAIFQLLNAVRLKNLPVRNSQELAQVRMRASDVELTRGNKGAMRYAPVTNPLWEQIRDRQEAFSGIAKEYWRAGQKDEASNLLSKALQVSRTEKDPYFKAIALAHIADQFAEMEGSSQVLDISGEALEAIRSTTSGDDAYRATALSAVASHYVRCGKYSEALLLAKEIREPYSKAETLIRIIRPNQYSLALQIIEAIDDTYVRAGALAKMAVKYAEEGEKDKAVQLLDRALTSARSTGDNYYKAIALAKVAASYFKIDDSKSGAPIFSSSLDAAKGITDAYHQSRALAIIAADYFKAGEGVDTMGEKVLNEIISQL